MSRQDTKVAVLKLDLRIEGRGSECTRSFTERCHAEGGFGMNLVVYGTSIGQACGKLRSGRARAKRFSFWEHFLEYERLHLLEFER